MKLNISSALPPALATFLAVTSLILAIKYQDCRVAYVEMTGSVLIVCTRTAKHDNALSGKRSQKE